MRDKYYVGIDLHRKQSTIAILDKEGGIVKEGVLRNEGSEITEFLKICPKGTKIAIEATRNWYWQYDLLTKEGYDVRLGNPHKIKANLAARKKTDKLDAKVLANLIRTNFYPEAHAAVGYQRQLFELLRARETFVKHQTQLKNRIHAQLGKYNLNCPYTDMFGRDGMEWLKKQNMDKHSNELINDCLDLLELTKIKIKNLEKELKEATKGDMIIEALKEVPGVGFITACWLRAAIGDIDRFPSAKKLCAYFGIVPSTYQSSENVRHGHITRCGNPKIRAIMVEAAHRARRYNDTSRKIFMEIAYRRGRKIAYVALARKLLTKVYYAWENAVKTGEPVILAGT